MSESVNLPALGESVTEGTVTRWLKNVGDRVEVDEPLLEVSTDKVDTETPHRSAGVIEAILVAEDETVEVGTPLVTIGDGSGTAAPAAPAPARSSADARTGSPRRAGTDPRGLPRQSPSSPSRSRLRFPSLPRLHHRARGCGARRRGRTCRRPRRCLRHPRPPQLRPPRSSPRPAPASASKRRLRHAHRSQARARQGNRPRDRRRRSGIGGRIRKQDVLAAGTTISKTAPAPAEQRESARHFAPCGAPPSPCPRLRKGHRRARRHLDAVVRAAHLGGRGRRDARSRTSATTSRSSFPQRHRPQAVVPCRSSRWRPPRRFAPIRSSTPPSTAIRSSTLTTRTSASRSTPSVACSPPRSSATPRTSTSPDSRRRSRTSRPAPGRTSSSPTSSPEQRSR